MRIIFKKFDFFFGKLPTQMESPSAGQPIAGEPISALKLANDVNFGGHFGDEGQAKSSEIAEFSTFFDNCPKN